MTDLLTPEEVRHMKGIRLHCFLSRDTVDIARRLRRDYLTLWDRNKELEKERDQWKANHDCQVEMKHRLHERYDTLMKHFNGEVVL